MYPKFQSDLPYSNQTPLLQPEDRALFGRTVKWLLMQHRWTGPKIVLRSTGNSISLLWNCY